MINIDITWLKFARELCAANLKNISMRSTDCCWKGLIRLVLITQDENILVCYTCYSKHQMSVFTWKTFSFFLYTYTMCPKRNYSVSKTNLLLYSQLNKACPYHHPSLLQLFFFFFFFSLILKCLLRDSVQILHHLNHLKMIILFRVISALRTKICSSQN